MKKKLSNILKKGLGKLNRVPKFKNKSEMSFKEFKRKNIAEMRPYILGEELPSNVSISEADTLNGSPKEGDMIARNPKNHNDQWLVSAKYFSENFEPKNIEINELSGNITVEGKIIESKTLVNTDANQAKKNVSDLVIWGDGDLFKLISKASSKAEGWMKSTKAMEIPGIGCIVQVTTQQGGNVAEAAVFAPGTAIKEFKDDDGKVISRKLVKW